MKTKKSDKVNLEKFKFLFAILGLNLALLIIFCAFEISSKSLSIVSFSNSTSPDITENDIEITLEKELPQEVEVQVPEVIKEQSIEKFLIVDENVKTKDFGFTSEFDKNAPMVISMFNPDVFTSEPEVENIVPVPFTLVEDKPEYPGGDVAMLQFIKDNIVYPPQAKEIGIQGRVYVQFVIDKNGNVTQVATAKSVDPYLDAEAERVVKKLPAWSPGKQRGKAVPVTFILPINFKLN